MSVLDDFFGDSSNDDYISPETLEEAEVRRQQEEDDRMNEASEIYVARRRKNFDRTGLTNREINLMIEFGFAVVVNEESETEYASWKFVGE
jgi:hypothetical protein